MLHWRQESSMKIQCFVCLLFWFGSVSAQGDSDRLIQNSYKRGEIIAHCKRAIDIHLANIDKIVRVVPGDRTFENTLVAFERTVERYFDTILPLYFIGEISESEDTRKEYDACSALTTTLSQRVYARNDLAQIFKSTNPLTLEDKRLKEKTLESFEPRTTSDLSLEQKEQLVALGRELNRQSTLFQNNLRGELPTLLFSDDDLEGVPPLLLANLKKSSTGKWLVPANEALLPFASQSETRKKILTAVQTRGGTENLRILKIIIGLRQQIALLSGHSDWLDFQAQHRMAKSSKRIRSFLTELGERVQKKKDESIAELLKIKRLRDSDAKEIFAWDVPYLKNELRKQKFNLNEAELQEYFPVEGVIQNLFQIYSKIFKVEFIKLKNRKFWAEAVEAFEIRDAEDHHLIAYFYLDLYHRPMKEGLSYVTTLRVGRIEDGKLVPPVSVILDHFSNPTKKKPSLLNQEDLLGLIAHFDYVFHQSFTKTPYGTLSGWNMDWNFVFTSAIMFQNLYYSPQFLEAVSGHYNDPKRKNFRP